MEGQVQGRHLVGVAPIVVRSNTIVGIATAGVKRQRESTPLESTDMWHLGSNTKAITATMVARLVEAGQLSWTATPLEIFPELNGTMHPAYRHITIEQLLSHHAGIPQYAKFGEWPKLSGSAVEQRSRFAAWALGRAPAITPGTKGLYFEWRLRNRRRHCERRTGTSWEDWVNLAGVETSGNASHFRLSIVGG